jgi:cyclic pyranopterin phosphate synthase
MSKLSHLDAHGAARMVDVTEKNATAREAQASAVIVLSPDAYNAALSSDAPKGDVLGVARLAGIMAAKRTSELIPLCHPIPLTGATIEFELQDERSALRILATARTTAQTGVEMEALVAATVAALTVYDMVKAIDRGPVIEHIRLLSKSGGKSGTYTAPNTSCAVSNE